MRKILNFSRLFFLEIAIAHLTFSQEFLSFIEQRDITRKKVIDAILWCVGAIVSKSKLVTSF
jgi:hypothetical protein